MLTRVLFFSPILFFFSMLHAGGFQINAQGQRQLGMGHTGTGLCLDASSLFFNPGAMGFIDKRFVFSGGTTLLFPRVVYQEPSPGIYSESMVHNVGTPFTIYANWNSEKVSALSIGIGIYTPFGSRAQWPDDWKGQFLIREINLKTIFIQPTVSWQINECIGLGLGFVYATGSFGLRKGVPVQNASAEYGEGKLSGAAKGIGFNAGIYFKAKENWSAGLSYRSSVNVEVKNGEAQFTVAPSLAEYFPATTFSTAIKLPAVLSGGLGYSISKWKFAADINVIGWSTYDTLRIDFETNTDKLADINDPRCYKDVFIVRAGAQFQITDHIELLAGAYYDASPVKDGYLTPETPDANRLGFTCGTAIHFFEKFSAAVSLLYIEGLKRTDTNITTGFSGTYKSKVIAPSFGIQYKF